MYINKLVGFNDQREEMQFKVKLLIWLKCQLSGLLFHSYYIICKYCFLFIFILNILHYLKYTTSVLSIQLRALFSLSSMEQKRWIFKENPGCSCQYNKSDLGCQALIYTQYDSLVNKDQHLSCCSLKISGYSRNLHVRHTEQLSDFSLALWLQAWNFESSQNNFLSVPFTCILWQWQG